MFDAEAVRQILSIESAAWTATIVFLLLALRAWNGAPHWIDRWLEYRKIKAAEKAADWSRLREENKRLDDRCIRLEVAEERCRTELSNVKSRLMELESYMAGQGRATQEAAGVVALERLDQIEHLERPDAGGDSK